MQAKEFVSHGIPVTQVQVETEQDMKDLNRARGRYITLETGPLTHLVNFEGACACLSMPPEVQKEYDRVEDILKGVLKNDRKAAKKILSAYLNPLTAYPDQPYGHKPI